MWTSRSPSGDRVTNSVAGPRGPIARNLGRPSGPGPRDERLVVDRDGDLLRMRTARWRAAAVSAKSVRAPSSPADMAAAAAGSRAMPEETASSEATMRRSAFT